VTYFDFLALFLGIPITALSVWTIVDKVRGKWLPQSLNTHRAWGGMVALCVVALIYTTPWDNYLVATRVWWYDPQLVTGIVFGWVPIEEYTFFLLQPIMGCLLFFTLARYLPSDSATAQNLSIRWWATGITAIGWFIMTVLLVLSLTVDMFRPITYLALELSWALIPIVLQLAFGADIIWRHRWLVFLTIGIATLYLGWADSLAINGGTWTIDPEQSLNIFIGGILPIEEFIFFLLTNTLVAFGITIIIAEESLERAMKVGHYAPFRPLLRWIRPNLSEGV
jgi:lycopene beta-cyclase